MLEIIGALAVTAIDIFLISFFLGVPIMGAMFAGINTWYDRFIVLLGVVMTGLVAWSWWAFIGSNIHVDFG